MIKLNDDELNYLFTFVDTKAMLTVRTINARIYGLATNEALWEGLSKLQHPELNRLQGYTWKQHFIYVHSCLKKSQVQLLDRSRCGTLERGQLQLSWDKRTDLSNVSAFAISNHDFPTAVYSTVTGSLKILSTRFLETEIKINKYVSALRWFQNNYFVASSPIIEYWSDGNCINSIETTHQTMISCLEVISYQKRNRYIFSGSEEGNICTSCIHKGQWRFLNSVACFSTVVDKLCALEVKDRLYLTAGSLFEDGVKMFKIEGSKLICKSSIEKAHIGGVLEIKKLGKNFYSLGRTGELKKWSLKDDQLTLIKQIDLPNNPSSFIPLEKTIEYITKSGIERMLN